MAKYYAWSDLRNGGKVEEIGTPGGGRRMVVLERNITPRGEEVSASKLDISKKEFEALVESGSIRPYPLPEEASDTLSPAQAVLARLALPGGEVNQDMLMELALKHPPGFTVSAREIPAGA